MTEYTPYSFLTLILLFCFLFDLSAQRNLITPFERNNNASATYSETIAFYEQLDAEFSQLHLSAHGNTDSGHPLHLAILSKDEDFSPESIRRKNKRVIFINNAIHPGEPCGVDGSMVLLRDYLTKPELQEFLDHVVLVVIPFYNIGGGLNRGSYSRANQNGPEAYGFRGNARNYDLNRDFIKCDTRNAQTFNQIYAEWQPDIFIDNHTSNGADYQYAITLIPTQHNKLDPHLAKYLNGRLLPHMFKEMKARSYEMTPYVYARTTPDEGIAGFLDLPRYSSGYAALHNTISFMPETHMLKPFKDRVMSVYHFMDCMIRFVDQEWEQLAAVRQKAVEHTRTKKKFDLNWALDPERSDKILFKGYEAGYKPSAISGKDRLYYDRNAPYEKEIPHFNYYKPTLSVAKPIAYIIPQGYTAVIDRLRWNGVTLQQLTEATEVEVEMYRIKDYKSGRQPYEGHYLHREVEVEKEVGSMRFHKGDVVVYTDQPANRYIVETLEPQGPDSYFAWNFFDGILQQKEYFSSYVFEDLAEAFLEENPTLKAELEQKKSADEAFANSARAQLDFIYKQSPYYEPTHMRYPVGRLMKKIQLPLK